MHLRQPQLTKTQDAPSISKSSSRHLPSLTSPHICTYYTARTNPQLISPPSSPPRPSPQIPTAENLPTDPVHTTPEQCPSLISAVGALAILTHPSIPFPYRIPIIHAIPSTPSGSRSIHGKQSTSIGPKHLLNPRLPDDLGYPASQVPPIDHSSHADAETTVSHPPSIHTCIEACRDLDTTTKPNPTEDHGARHGNPYLSLFQQRCKMEVTVGRVGEHQD